MGRLQLSVQLHRPPRGQHPRRLHRRRDAGGFSYPFNFTGHPAASIPAGFTAAGMPVGLQIVGRRNADLTVLQASAAFEQARPWAQRRPLH